MKIICSLLLFISFASFSANKNPSCNHLSRVLNEQSNLSQKEREILSELMSKIFEIIGEKIEQLPEKMAFKMDVVLTSELREKIKLLDEDQLQTFKGVISRSKKEYLDNIRHFGRIEDSPYGPQEMFINMNAYYDGHPSTRIILWHELDHAFQFILQGDLSIKGLETSAFKAEYNLIKIIFSLDDLKTIKENFPIKNHPQKLIQRLRKFGVISSESEEILIYRSKLEKLFESEESRSDGKELVSRSFSNKELIRMISSSLEKSEKEYIQESLLPYRKRIFKQNLFVYTTTGTIFFVPAYILYLLLY